MQERHLSAEAKQEALDKLEELTKDMTSIEKKRLLKAIQDGRARIMSQEELDKLKEQNVQGVEAVPLKKGNSNITKPINTPKKKASRKKNRASSRARAKNRK